MRKYFYHYVIMVMDQTRKQNALTACNERNILLSKDLMSYIYLIKVIVKSAKILICMNDNYCYL